MPVFVASQAAAEVVNQSMQAHFGTPECAGRDPSKRTSPFCAALNCRNVGRMEEAAARFAATCRQFPHDGAATPFAGR